MGVGRKKVVKQKARSSGLRKNILHGFLVYQYEMLQMPVELQSSLIKPIILFDPL